MRPRTQKQPQVKKELWWLLDTGEVKWSEDWRLNMLSEFMLKSEVRIKWRLKIQMNVALVYRGFVQHNTYTG